VSVDRLWLTDFRNHASVDVVLDPGVTLVVGSNGQGKTNLIEAIAWLARGSSFRGAPNEALIRHGADQAVVRAEVTEGERTILLEAEITGRTQPHPRELESGPPDQGPAGPLQGDGLRAGGPRCGQGGSRW